MGTRSLTFAGLLVFGSAFAVACTGGGSGGGGAVNLLGLLILGGLLLVRRGDK